MARQERPFEQQARFRGLVTKSVTLTCTLCGEVFFKLEATDTNWEVFQGQHHRGTAALYKHMSAKHPDVAAAKLVETQPTER